MFELLWPWAYAVLAVPLVVWLVTQPIHSNQLALYVPNIDSFQIEGRSPGNRMKSPIGIAVLIVLAWMALATALARPQWTGESTTLPTMHRDFVLVLDISGSMANTDMAVGGQTYTRLSVAKYVINEFIQGRSGDRIGLVLFGTQPYVYVPLTADMDTAGSMLQDAPVGIAGRSTAIGDALGLAIKQLLNHPADHRVIVLLTDGVSNAGELRPEDAAELAAASNVKIYSIGLSPESSSTGFFGSVFSLQSGRSELDTQLLKHLASTTNGRYFEAANVSDLEIIYNEIDQLEPIEQESLTIRPVKSLFHIPLAIALALFGLATYMKLRTHA